MALKEANRMYRATASGGLSMTAPANESYRVRRVFCKASSNDKFVTAVVNGRSVGKYRAGGLGGNQIPYPAQYSAAAYEGVVPGVFDGCLAHGLDLSIPVASGETFSLSRYAETGDLTVVYDVYDAGDVKPDEPNGSQAKVLRYLYHFWNTSACTTSPINTWTSEIWTGGRQWPSDGSALTAAEKVRLYGILACPVAHDNGTVTKGYTTLLKIMRDAEVLFDKVNQTGLPFLAVSTGTGNAAAYTPAASVVGPGTMEVPRPGLWFPEPMEFKVGDALTFEVAVGSAASGGIAANEVEICLALELATAG